MRTGTVTLLSGTILLPLKICSRASNLPGPQLWNGVLSTTAGDRETMAPTFSVRLGQPSSRRPIPVVTESSTVEWHSAQVMPKVARWLFGPVTLPITPTTALSFSNWSVTAGSSRFTCPAWMALITAAGSASESTFNPTARAVRGLTSLMTFCICSVSVHFCSSPNVSNRKMDLPSVLVCDCPCETPKIRATTDNSTVESRDMCSSSRFPLQSGPKIQPYLLGCYLTVRGCGCAQKHPAAIDCNRQWENPAGLSGFAPPRAQGTASCHRNAALDVRDAASRLRRSHAHSPALTVAIIGSASAL